MLPECELQQNNFEWIRAFFLRWKVLSRVHESMVVSKEHFPALFICKYSRKETNKLNGINGFEKKMYLGNGFITIILHERTRFSKQIED